MSIVQKHPRPQVEPPRDSSDLRAAEALAPGGIRMASVAANGAHREHLRMARIGESIVGVCRIEPEHLRLGESRLKAGAITGLHIHRQFDAHEIRDALLDDALGFLARHRFHIALSTGPELNLRRRGFGEVFRISPRLLEFVRSDCEMPKGYALRPGKPADIGAMAGLFASTQDDADCGLLRSRAQFAHAWNRIAPCCVLANRDGRVVAYFVSECDGPELWIREIAWSESVPPSILRQTLRHYTAACECTRLWVSTSAGVVAKLEPDESVGEQHAEPLQGFVRPVDIEELLQSMIPEWESGWDGRSAELCLVLDGTSYRIRSQHGAIAAERGMGVNKLTMTRADFARLIFGSTDPRQYLNAERRLLSPEAVAFASSLFRERSSGLGSIDIR